jgi:hypothetical protein
MPHPPHPDPSAVISRVIRTDVPLPDDITDLVPPFPDASEVGRFGPAFVNLMFKSAALERRDPDSTRCRIRVTINLETVSGYDQIA